MTMVFLLSYIHISAKTYKRYDPGGADELHIIHPIQPGTVKWDNISQNHEPLALRKWQVLELRAILSQRNGPAGKKSIDAGRKFWILQ